MSKLHEAIAAWKESPPYEGVRAAEHEDIEKIDDESRIKMETILEAMEWPQLIVFKYGDSDRVAAPFVLGISSGGNPLMRAYQLEGISRSGKGEGWRVFQIVKMENVENHQDFFDYKEYEFNDLYPWTYKVIRMVKGVEIDLSQRQRERYAQMMAVK
ncbi:MAG: hypothetical protein KG012_14140 [Deltaproteobacteria bacterium]|nr:hypothetical protein [Deltaproteobacteria bacterium]MBS3920014.1 hypothetical protein [Deltaproteobacteria bacterium]